MIITLRELLALVDEAEKKAKLPTAKALLTSDVPIVAKEVLGSGCEVTVYQNGYVLYVSGNRRTVFALHSCCTSYQYETVEPKMRIASVKLELFLDEKWFWRLALEGEDRLELNQDKRIGSHSISYSAVAEDWDVMGSKMDVLDEIVEKEECSECITKLASVLTEKQMFVICAYYMEGADQSVIASILGVTKQAVSDMIRKARKRVQKAYVEHQEKDNRK